MLRLLGNLCICSDKGHIAQIGFGRQAIGAGLPESADVSILKQTNMDNEQSFQRLAAVTAIISAPLAFATLVLGSVAVDFNYEAFSDPELVLSVGSSGASLLGWGMVADIFGYYLLLAPLALFLWHWLRPKDPKMADLYTFSGLAYMVIGAIGAGFLWMAWPSLINSYAAASVQQREAIEIVFKTVTAGIKSGVWGMEAIPAGIWWLGIGFLLRTERRVLGIVTIVLGAFTFLTFVAAVLGLEPVFQIAFFVYLFLAPIWALWLGIDLLRKPVA